MQRHRAQTEESRGCSISVTQMEDTAEHLLNVCNARVPDLRNSGKCIA